jgi:hypothetical protein
VGRISESRVHCMSMHASVCRRPRPYTSGGYSAVSVIGGNVSRIVTVTVTVGQYRDTVTALSQSESALSVMVCQRANHPLTTDSG